MNRYIITLIVLTLFSIIEAKIPRVFVAIKNKEIIANKELKILIGAKANDKSKIEIPSIKQIGGYKVLSKELETSKEKIKDKNITIIKKAYLYKIKPLKSFDMPIFTIKIDNKEYKTIPFKVQVKNIQDTNTKEQNQTTKKIKKDNIKPKNIEHQNIVQNSDFIFKMSSNKKSVRVGESFIVTITLIEPINLSSSDLQYFPPNFEGFDFEPMGEGDIKESSNSVIRTIKYILTPKKSGELTINPARAKIGIELTPQTQSPFGFFGANIEWKKLKTNSLKIDVKSIPKSVDLVGKFKIESETYSKYAKPDKPFEYEVKIIGIGKLDNLSIPNLNIDNITVYQDEPKIEQLEKKGILISKFTQKFTFISNKDFTIPSIKLKALNPKSGKIYTLETKSLDIKVKKINKITSILNSKNTPTKSTTNTISKNPTKSTINNPKDIKMFENILIDKEYYKRKYNRGYPLIAIIGALILGVILGIAIAILIPGIFRVKNSNTKLKNRLYGSYEEALNILYPHITKSKAIENMVANLYEITNGNNDVKIDEFALNRLIKKIKDGKI